MLYPTMRMQIKNRLELLAGITVNHIDYDLAKSG